MKNIYKVFCLVVMAGIVACEDAKTAEVKSEAVKDSVEVVETHEDIQDELHLHGTEKWKVSEHMVAHIQIIDSLVNNYTFSADNTPNDLALDVDSELKKVTQTCDMQGEAHAQLHLWLLPFWNLVDVLKESGDVEQQLYILGDLKESLYEYHEFFE